MYISDLAAAASLFVYKYKAPVIKGSLNVGIYMYNLFIVYKNVKGYLVF